MFKNKNFPQLGMAKFSDAMRSQKLISMHGTNPQAFTQSELEKTIGRSFADILSDVDLGFSPDEGTLALRQTLSDFHYKHTAYSEIMTFAGAQEALFCVYNAILEAGDKVLSVSPVYQPLLQIPVNIGCEVSTVELDGQDNWSLDLNKVESHFKKGCRLFVINFPHNPTGATLILNQFDSLISLCRKYGVWLLSDEVFRGLEHQVSSQLPTVADSYEKGISVGVISKGYAVPGIRVGWMACHDADLRMAVNNVKGYLSVCNSQIDEALASEVLKYPDKLSQRNLLIILNNKKQLKHLTHLQGYKVKITVPIVGCCVFAQLLDETITTDSLAQLVAKESGYLIFPSNLFCTNQKGFRIGFGTKKFSDFIKANSP